MNKNKKNIVESTIPTYPFGAFDTIRRCHKCNQLLRFSSIHQREYVVSEFQNAEILKMNHVCSKDKRKRNDG